MLKRIKTLEPISGFRLLALFDDGYKVIYDMSEDIETLPGYSALKTVYGLFPLVQLDKSRTCVYWNPEIDLASDIIYEYGTPVDAPEKTN